MKNDAGIKTIATPGSNIVTVDHSIKPTYPHWMKKLSDPEFENTSPSRIDPSTIILYLHPEQENIGRVGNIAGLALYEFIKTTGLIRRCLDLRFGEELFRQNHLYPQDWGLRNVCLWKSVIVHQCGDLVVPCIGDMGRLGWCWLGSTSTCVLSADAPAGVCAG